jgi:RNA ligase (TIGR02306 family)
MERKLASIQKVAEIRPIEGADAIEVARINNWNVVVKKGEYKTGDLCIYCEIDSFLPVKEEFEFLRKSSFKKMGDQEGFRLKTIRLRGQLSQGLLLPLTVLNEVYEDEEMVIGVSEQPQGPQMQLGPYDDALIIEEGVDVTELLGIVKYEPPIPAELAGKVKGGFPSFLRKTDEERVQNLTTEYQEWLLSSKHQFYVAEKLDGSSATFYMKDGQFGVCSRNLELADPGEFVPGTVVCEDGVERPKQENTFWKVAKELNLAERMAKVPYNICIQGELIGEGIQKNPYKLKGHTVRIFNAFNIDAQEYLSLGGLAAVCAMLGLEMVPILESPFQLPATIDEMLKYAEGKSVLNSDTEREGVVVRSLDRTISFKAISNTFLLKEKE